MPFHRVYCQLRVTVIKVKGFPLQFWPGGNLAPGKSEGQEHVDNDIIGSPAANEGLVSYPAA